MIEALADWNPWWTSGDVDRDLLGRTRDVVGEATSLLRLRQIKTVTGLRRAGKSTLLYQVIAQLLGQGVVDPRRILLVNFEDPVLAHATLEQILDVYERRIGPTKRPYLFLDEVHRCAGWAPFLRKLYDLRKIEQAFLTDSSSRILPREYGQLYTGRAVHLAVFPLSFREVLAWRGLRGEDPLRREDRNRVHRALDEYLRWGGLPEVVLERNACRRKRLLNDYLGDIVHRDIVERYRAEYHKVRALIEYLVTNAGSRFSPRRYVRIHGLSLEALSAYTSYATEVFLFRAVPRFSFKLSLQRQSPKKFYLSDTGFYGAAGFRLMETRGRLCEHAVATHLFRSGNEVYYWEGKRECDFVVREGPGQFRAIQVCEVLTSETREREFEGLVEAMDEVRTRRGIVVTLEQEGKERIGTRTVTIVPLWRFLQGEGSGGQAGLGARRHPPRREPPGRTHGKRAETSRARP